MNTQRTAHTTNDHRTKVIARTSQINNYKNFSENLVQGKVNVRVG